MKQPFVCATIAAKRKGREARAQGLQHHPLREEVVGECGLAPIRIPSVPAPKVDPKSDDLARFQAEVARKLSAIQMAPKPVAAKKISGMIKPVDEAKPEPLTDILKILSGLK